jgi:hypothetical protein
MTVHVEVLSLWRGVLRQRCTLAELARGGGYDVAELRAQFGPAAQRRRYHEFVAEAVEAGHALTDIARFLRRERTTIWKAIQRFSAQQVSK